MTLQFQTAPDDDVEDAWTERMMRRQGIYDLWSQYAGRGEPPRIPDVATALFGYTVPWFWNDHFFPVLKNVGHSEYKDLVCREVSRGHGKTALAHLMVLYTACFIIPFIEHARRENKRILVIGRDVEHMKDLMDELHGTICEYAPWLKYDEWSVIGESPEQIMAQGMKGGARTWNTRRMDLTNGISIRGFAISQSVRRYHCYMALIDDLVTEDNASDAEYQMQLIEGGILKAIEYGGLVLMLGTPQDDLDVFAKARENDKWDYLQLPGKSPDYVERNKKAIHTGELPPRRDGREYTPDDLRCLWPWRMNAAEHRWERGNNRETQLLYDKEILLKRVSLIDALIDPNDVIGAKDSSLCYVRSRDDPLEANVKQYAGGVDPSALSRSDAAMVIGTVDSDGVIIPRHWRIMEARGANRSKYSTLEVVEMINDVSMAFGNPEIQCEGNQFQEMIAPLIEVHLNPSVRINAVHMGGDKNEKAGWVSIRTIFGSGKIRLPYGPTPEEKRLIEAGELDPVHIEAIAITDKFIGQLQRIRRKDGKVITPRGVKDDMVSAFFQFTKAAALAFYTEDGGAVAGTLKTTFSDTEARQRLESQKVPIHGIANHVSAIQRVRKAQQLRSPRRRFM